MDVSRGGLNTVFGRPTADRRRPTPSEELLGALPTPLLVIDDEGVIHEINGATEMLLNLSRSAIVGMGVAEAIGHTLMSLPSGAMVTAYDQEIVLPGARAQQADLLVAPWAERPGWRIVTLHLHPAAGPIARRSGREGGSRTAAGAAAMLAHEIKNPLAGIRGAAQLLETSVDAEARPLTRLIREEVDRVAALIDRMENFTDTRPLDCDAQNIHAILEHARAVAVQGIPASIQIREIYDPSLPAVLGHRDSLVQVLINLIKNAAEALGPLGGTITLTTAYRHGIRMLTDRGLGRRALPIEVCVIDDGPGPPHDIAEHLFDPFVTSKPTGRGLGLALVQKLIVDQGGMVEYAREGRPERTVFRLMLPLAERRR